MLTTLILLLLALGVALALRYPRAVQFHTESERMRSLLPRLLKLRRYEPAPLLPTGVLQSMAAEFYPPDAAATPFRRELVRLPALDAPRSNCCPPAVPAGVVSLDWLEQRDDRAPTALLCPGLTSSSDSVYIRRVAVALHATGLRVVVFNPRSRGGVPLETPFLYSAGFTEDLRRVVERVVKHVGRSTKMLGVGFSLGAQYLLKYVCEEGAACKLSAALVFAAPFDCVGMINHLEGSFVGGLVNPTLVRSVQAVRMEHEELLAAAGYDLERVAAAKGMYAFDDAAIAPMMGCPSAAEYYRQASVCGGAADNLLKRLSVPTLAVSAANDPICPANVAVDAVRQALREAGSPPPPLLLAVTASGGHGMVWPSGLKASRAWACEVAVEWARATVQSETC